MNEDVGELTALLKCHLVGSLDTERGVRAVHVEVGRVVEHGAEPRCEVGAPTGRLNSAEVAGQTGTLVNCNINTHSFIHHPIQVP